MVRLSALRARATRASSRIEPSRSHTLTRWRAARAEGDKHEIILALEPQNHTAGEVLMRQNVQPAMQSLLFVQEGECSVTLSLDNGQDVTVATLQAPFYIGERRARSLEPSADVPPLESSSSDTRTRARARAGEVGLLTGTPPTATVTVLSPTMKAYVLRRNYVLERNLGDNSMFKVMERKMEVRKFERLQRNKKLFTDRLREEHKSASWANNPFGEV